jgi:hypothetical protein
MLAAVRERLRSISANSQILGITVRERAKFGKATWQQQGKAIGWRELSKEIDWKNFR